MTCSTWRSLKEATFSAFTHPGHYHPLFFQICKDQILPASRVRASDVHQGVTGVHSGPEESGDLNFPLSLASSNLSAPVDIQCSCSTLTPALALTLPSDFRMVEAKPHLIFTPLGQF